MKLALKNFFQKIRFRQIRNKLSSQKIKVPHLSVLMIIFLIFGLGLGAGYGIFGQNRTQIPKDQFQKDNRIAFLTEIYDKILENYWDSISDEQLAQLFKQASEKITGRPQKLKLQGQKPANPSQTPLPAQNSAPLSINLQGSSINDLKMLTQEDSKPVSNGRQALEEMLTNILKDLDETKRIEFTKTLSAAVLSSLQPLGRSGLFSQKQEEQLKNTVSNINPDKDLYKDLGIQKGASKDEVEKAYQQQSEKLSQDKSDQAQKKLDTIAYAKDVLSQEDKKKNYDTAGIEPTVFSKNYPPNIVYLKFVKFSPTTYDEFVKLVNSFDKEGGPKTLIFDLRQNIGGAIDALPFFLGNFLGDKQHAYEFLHKGEYETYKTIGAKLSGLTRMKQVVILIDNQTQSSAELMASALKKYHFGVLLGESTKGWGSVEKVFSLENQFDPREKFSLFLVHSITLRDDGQPIEGRGVEPDINIKDPDWEGKLFEYFRNTDLEAAVKIVL